MKYKYFHPYTLIIIFRKYSGIIALPIISQLIWLFLKEYKIIKNPIYINTIVIVSIIVFIFIKYFNEKIKVINKRIEIKIGIIKKKTFFTYMSSIKTAKIEFSILSKLTGAYKLKLLKPIFYTPFKDGIYLNKNILYNVLDQKFSRQKFDTVKINSFFSSFVLSVFWINPVNILFVSVPFLNKINKILSDTIKEKIYSTLDIRMYFIAFGLSPLIATVILVILILLFITTFLHFLHYAKFEFKKSKDYFCTKSGFLIKYRNIINKSDINAISIKQSLSMKIIKFGSIYYHTNKSSKLKGNNFLLLGGTQKECVDILSSLGYSFKSISKAIKFAKSLRSFIYLPLSMLIFNLFFLLFLKINHYNEILVVFMELLELYIVWWTAMRVFAYKNTSISINNTGDVIIKGYKGMSLIETYIKTERIKSIIIKQNIFQRYFNCCNIYIYTSPNKDDIFFAKNLEYQSINEILNMINIVV